MSPFNMTQNGNSYIVAKTYSAAYRSQANVMVEWCNHIFMTMLWAVVSEQQDFGMTNS